MLSALFGASIESEARCRRSGEALVFNDTLLLATHAHLPDANHRIGHRIVRKEAKRFSQPLRTVRRQSGAGCGWPGFSAKSRSSICAIYLQNAFCPLSPSQGSR
jgi:hypothetical protein